MGHSSWQMKGKGQQPKGSRLSSWQMKGSGQQLKGSSHTVATQHVAADKAEAERQ